MKQLLLSISLVIVSTVIFSQTLLNQYSSDITFSETEPIRTFNDEGLKGIDIDYQFPGIIISEKDVNSVEYSFLNIKDFSYMKTVGKAALPSHNDLIAVPMGATIEIEITNADYIVYSNHIVYPALKPASDTYGASEPEFERDEKFYSSDLIYPDAPVEVVETLKVRGMDIAVVQIRPVQYNPARSEIRVYTNIEYSVKFIGGSRFIDSRMHSDHFKSTYPAVLLNKASVIKEIDLSNDLGSVDVKNPNSRNYIIVTNSAFYDAALALAEWKQQLGYSVELLSQSSWSSTEVMNSIHSRYTAWEPKPDFFVIIGDNQDVPGVSLSGFSSDLYYSCMDGSFDYTPDMAYGRISVSSSTQADIVVQKIINYEKYPVGDTTFYSKGLNCAYFQEASNGYAERRFAQTSEDVRNYMTNSIGFDVERVYVTGSTVYPTNWNDGYYSAGEPLPSYLLKPTFPWDGNATDIINEINDGQLFVLHRDHGFESGWGDPYFTNSNINSLTNGDLLPVVFSINCLTGKFVENECFSEKFLRQDGGGAVGVFGHAEVSYSGYNDALAFGLFDAIWADPGFIPVFTGSNGVSNPSCAPHDPIITMGDVKNHGLLRMTETWDANQYTNELLHYFGDPAMKIYTDVPGIIIAENNDTINCTSDTSITITNCTMPDGYATFVVDAELIASVQLANGSGTLTFDPTPGQFGLLTVSKHNYRPYIDTVIILGDCPKSKFTIGDSHFCLADSVTFYDNSTGTITGYNWDFGIGASPATASSIGPHVVYYSVAGEKTITLEVSGPNGTHSSSQTIAIDDDCNFYMPLSGTETSEFCFGKLYDDGGDGNYSDNTSGTFIIQPNGASSIMLDFSSFNFEYDWDTLFIYDGNISLGLLIGVYTGTGLPNGGTIISTQGSITLYQQTDEAVTESGFELEWSCNYPNSPPMAAFMYSTDYSCTGPVEFVDISTNGPNEWLWDFGDGNISNLQHPTHVYTSNGNFSVTLITINSFGQDTVVETSIITINRPDIPVTNDESQCGANEFILNANSTGIVYWYSDSIGGSYLDTGITYLTPNLSQSTIYYVENIEAPPAVFGGEFDNLGGGSIFTAAVSHYLVFDCINTSKLVSVKVYASGAGDRSIELRNSGGIVLESGIYYLPDGESRVYLNWNIEPGIDYQLAGPLSPNLFRNNAGLNYPYAISDLVNVKYSSASTSPTGYYYYFYDWEVTGQECISARIPVEAIVVNDIPVPDFQYSIIDSVVEFDNQTGGTADFIWDFGDGAFSSEINPSHSYANGTYEVYLTAINACGDDSISYIVIVDYESVNDLSSIRDLSVYPIPATNLLNIDFSFDKAFDVEIELSNIMGQIIWSDILSNYEGKYSQSIDIKGFSPGVYLLNITTDRGRVSRKIIIQ